MARAKAPTKVAKRAPAKKSNAKIENNFAGGAAFGMGIFPQNQGSPYTEQVSNTETLFKNCRWYLVSNFYQLLCEIYAEIGLVSTIVDVPVDDGLRGGIEITSKQLDEEQITELMSAMDRDNDLVTLGYAAKWTRLFGGGGVMILTDEDPSTPFNINEITENSKVEFRDVDLWELFYSTQNMGKYNPTIQAANVEFYNYYGIQVHSSRVINMIGIKPPSFIRPRMRGWGLSVCETLVRSINQYLKSVDLTFEVLDEFKIDVYKIKNLVNTLLTPGGTQKVRERVQTANYLKNYQKAITMDSEDDYIQKQVSFTGLAEAQSGIRMQVASDMRMPLTKLFGISAAGFNSGEDDIEVYNSMIESQVRNKIKYPAMRMCEIKCKQLFGFVPDDITVTFKPLRVLSSEQEENVKTQKFNRLLQALERGAISVEEFRDACNRDNLLVIKVKDGGLDIQAYDDDTVEEDKKDENVVEMKERTINSARFDKASYEAEGGDSTFDMRRKYFFENPLDKGLWSTVKSISQEAYGQENLGFQVWLYKKRGGKFHNNEKVAV